MISRQESYPKELKHTEEALHAAKKIEYSCELYDIDRSIFFQVDAVQKIYAEMEMQNRHNFAMRMSVNRRKRTHSSLNIHK